MDTLELRAVSRLNVNPEEVVIPDYVEFYINGEPLSDLINEQTEPSSPVFSKYTSVLGTMELTNFDRLKIRQLQGQRVTKADLEELFPASHFDQKPIFDELKLPEILIYCCAECADYKCGGYFIKLQEEPEKVRWTITTDAKKLQFTFDKKAYRDELNTYLNELE